MPRRKKSDFTRNVGVDLRFESPVIQKLINIIMERGKKSIACAIVYGAMDILAKKVGNDDKKAYELFNKAFNQIAPFVEVRPRRVGGSVYQIPMEVPAKRRGSLTMRWTITAAQSRPGKSMAQKLAAELLDAIEGRGAAVKKKNEVQRMAEANRAFSHYAW
jgi:small subunit ribosomal protein S7